MKVLSLNLIRSFFLLLFVALLFNPAGAQVKAGAPGNISVRYAGIQNEHLVFYLQVENESKERYRFLVRDENRNVLFEETFTKQGFEKKILLVKGDISNVSFEVTARHYNYTRDFAISTRTVEEVIVAEKTK